MHLLRPFNLARHHDILAHLPIVSFGSRLSRTIAIIATLATASMLTGCAGGPSQKFSAQDRAAIKTVTVNPEVQMPPTLFYHGPAQSIGAAFGVIGAMASEPGRESASTRVLTKLYEEKISVQEIVKAEFSREAARAGVLTFSTNPAEAQAELVLAVNVYGISQAQGLSSTLYPMMNISATLKKKDGSIAWQKTDFATPANSDNKTGHTFAEYMAKPELLREAFTNIAGIVSRMLVTDLRKAD